MTGFKGRVTQERQAQKKPVFLYSRLNRILNICKTGKKPHTDVRLFAHRCKHVLFQFLNLGTSYVKIILYAEVHDVHEFLFTNDPYVIFEHILWQIHV